MSNDFDLIVIGAGPGGYPTAIRAAQLGLRVACIERERLGGVCLNWGCIPSKALLKTAELANKIRHADDFGLSVSEMGIDYDKVVGRSRKVASRFERGVKGLFKKYGVTSIFGTASLTASNSVQVVDADGGAAVHTAAHIVVATGAHARAQNVWAWPTHTGRVEPMRVRVSWRRGHDAQHAAWAKSAARAH